MLTLMIVEDHKWTREGLAKTIDWVAEGLTLKHICCDGREAWGILQKAPVDLIITDICMDGMDGLELTRCVKQKYPSTEIILISAYEEFKYAQQAVNLGASAYIIKPIETGELLKKVRVSAAKINAERTSEVQSKEYRKSALTKALNDFLFGDGNPGAGKTLEEQMKAAGVSQKTRALVFLAEPLPGGKGRAAMRDAINAAGDDIMAFESGGLCVGLYLMDEPTGYYVFRQKLVSALSGITADYRVCAGAVASDPEGLRKSCAGASVLLNRCFLRDMTGLQLCRGGEERTAARTASVSDADFLAEAVGERQNVREKLSALQASWMQAETPRKDVEAYCSRCLEILGKLAEKYGIPMQRVYNDCGDSQSSIGCGSLGGILNYLEQVASSLTELMAARGSASVRPVVVKALEYVRTEYANKEISLASAAEKLALNYSYLSKCFKEDVGVNFTDYLNQYRIEAAKKYLRSTSMKIYEICSLVGIDNRYFNHLFREYVGVSPHEYKNGAHK